jgi:hypothetical protein
MDLNWKIIESNPEFELLTVRYSDSGGQEYWRNLNPMVWTQDAIVSLIESHGPHVAAFFQRGAERKAAPAAVLPESGGFSCEPQKYWLEDEIPPTVIPEQPEFDMFTQRIEMSEQEPGDPEHTWRVIDLTAEEQAEMLVLVEDGLRMQRNQMLLESDFFNFPDACVANVQDWLDYRQALRDLPTDPSWPRNVLWPTRPAVVKESNQ